MKGAMYICWIIVIMQLEFLAIAAEMFRPAIVWELRHLMRQNIYFDLTLGTVSDRNCILWFAEEKFVFN